jgi:hypothetical protein
MQQAQSDNALRDNAPPDNVLRDKDHRDQRKLGIQPYLYSTPAITGRHFPHNL